MALRRKYIRSLAEKILADNGIRKPPVPVHQLVHALGIELRPDRVEDTLSGFLVRNSDTGRAVIGVNARHSEARQRFTIAHELGHYLLHEGETVHFDGAKPGFVVNLRS